MRSWSPPGARSSSPTEIALSSSAQVAVFLIPAVALLALLIEPLALAFREVEIVALGAVGRDRGGPARGRALEPAQGRGPDRRLRRHRGRVLLRRRALERRRLAAERIRREVELLDRAVARPARPAAARRARGPRRCGSDPRRRARRSTCRAREGRRRASPRAGPSATRTPSRTPRPTSGRAAARSPAARASPGCHASAAAGSASIAATARSSASFSGEAPAPVFVSTAAPILVLRLTASPARWPGMAPPWPTKTWSPRAVELEPRAPRELPALVVDHRADVRHLLERRRLQHAVVAGREERSPPREVAASSTRACRARPRRRDRDRGSSWTASLYGSTK